jgi:hypothetical protein
VPAFEFPPDLADADAVGTIFDDVEWYYRREPRPGVSVISDRLLELAFGGRR